MAGGFVHICVVSALFARRRRLGLSDEIRLALGANRRFCELGAVAPDYPYLDLMSAQQMKDWADRMHYERTAEPIRAGVRWLRQRDMPSRDKRRAIAWLLGYAAHVGTDLTVHPVVEACVGPYSENRTDHRICEMNQDAWIWRTRNLGRTDTAEYFDPIIRSTSREDGGIAFPIAELWENMLRSAYPEKAAALAPDIDGWHRAYATVIDAVEEGPRLFSFTRHLLSDAGLVYPSVDEIDMKFIENLDTPAGRMHYDDVFKAAQENVRAIWRAIDRALWEGSDLFEATLASIPDANLDTGRYSGREDLVFWNVA